MNAIVGQMLRCLIQDRKGSSWDSLLPSIKLTINALAKSSTAYSPFSFNYGYHPTVPIELIKGYEEMRIGAVDNFVKRVQSTWAQAKKNLLQSIRRQEKYYSSRHCISFKGFRIVVQKKSIVETDTQKLQRKFSWIFLTSQKG